MHPGDLPKASQDDVERLIVLYLHFDIDDYRSREERKAVPFPLPRFTIVEDSTHSKSLLHQIMNVVGFPTLLRDLEFDCLMKQFFINLYRANSKHVGTQDLTPNQIENISKIVAYIHEQQGMNIHYKELAELGLMSQQYLSRLFTRYTGQSLKEYIMRTKLDYALELLDSTRTNVTETAEALGYADMYTFSKQFKRCHGISPSQYIAKIRSN
jgi:YesN/AraC family two-component response regulator